jgi:hypothetical protein
VKENSVILSEPSEFVARALRATVNEDASRMDLHFFLILSHETSQRL